MNTWLITGGAGFIGSHFALQVLARIQPEDRVFIVDKMTYAAMDGARLRAMRINCPFQMISIENRMLMEELAVELRPNIWVNFAAESHVDRSIEDASPFVTTNVLGTQVLLSAALNCYRSLPAGRHFVFCHVSTDEVYGPWKLGSTGPGFSEQSQLDPRNPYAASKAAAEHLVMAVHHTHGLPTIITRGSNTYGSLQAPEKFLPLMVAKAMAGDDLPVYGDGLQEREWTHVSDHVQGILTAIDAGQPGLVYNVGSGQSAANLDVADRIVEIVGRGQVKHVTDRPGHDRKYLIDSHRLRSLGWRPQFDFLGESLEATVRWYMENPDWCFRNPDLTARRGLLNK